MLYLRQKKECFKEILMIIRESYYTHVSGSDGLSLAVLRIEPDDSSHIKGIVQVVHGMTEHKSRYIEFMKFLAQKGYITVIHDHRGHGDSVKSRDDLGFMYSGGYKALIEDTHEITREIKEYAYGETGRDDLPFTLIGHSMGSLVVRCFIKKYDNEIDNLCVLGCPSERKDAAIGLKFVQLMEKIKGPRFRSKLVTHIITGSYNKRFKDDNIEKAWTSSDLNSVRRLNDDPDCGFIFTLSAYIEMIKLTLETYSDKGYEKKNPKLRIKFFSGKEDPCGISTEAIRNAMRHIRKHGYKNLSGKIYPGMRHEVLNEREKEKVWKDILKFIEGK